MPKYTRTQTIEAERIENIEILSKGRFCLYMVELAGGESLTLTEEQFMRFPYSPGGYVVMDESWTFMNDMEGWEEDEEDSSN